MFAEMAPLGKRVVASTSLVAAASLPFLVAFHAPTQTDPVKQGSRLFIQYCAPCHGRDAKGSGPAAASLKKAPPDLTKIQKEGERFPAGQVMDIVAGDKIVQAHGSRVMPVWGTVLRNEKGYTQSQEDLALLVKYLESIQAQKASPK